MPENPYESPQSVDKAEQLEAKRPFLRQAMLLLAFQGPLLLFAALVLDGGRFMQVIVVTCIVMWIAFAAMSWSKQSSSGQD